ncbi:transcriptional regulator, AraC family [Pseudopedobacter saltans DSM 12145]|uniref:Transcriptional regulator, AraC family n=1 Tax=Pseudopedobacter saltans (strain ATCC 51119 / DSM 12145 / JCM 21818 / CCUG 39354 / LMG 10337 / NBRC 100064 / NCIMB 13643) TaxID=762903 RepID=F0SAK2_PSESL|nr:AraC family transcriptional regulator [Pseudopedobacter saltans]ADY52622.1 transcriptional regulator, AraC family [Pseudopedobacter saltans DSM 12145]
MKPQLLKVSVGPAQSFSVRQDSRPVMNNKWHYHPEVELIHFNKGVGTQFVGDSITKFNSGDILLIGSNLPHYWKFEESFLTNYTDDADIKVAHFSENFLGSIFLNLPENKPIKDILEKSKRGIRIIEGDKKKVAELLDLMLQTSGTERIIYMIQALLEISRSTEIEVLSSLGFACNMEEVDKDRMKDIYEYSYANFRNKINLEEIAEVAKVSPNSFCRYFKSRTHKTYSQFLMEIKVGQACRLLMDRKMNIKQICYESGFNNFASFHKCFKTITGKSPSIYQKEFSTQ